MAKILDDISRTFGEYLLLPRLTRRDQHIDGSIYQRPYRGLLTAHRGLFRSTFPLFQPVCRRYLVSI